MRANPILNSRYIRVSHDTIIILQSKDMFLQKIEKLYYYKASSMQERTQKEKYIASNK